MMYQALYRQYRPKTFDDVLGQEHITVTLKNQIKKNNISHAYLFSGTRGTGKTSTAKIFARAINCPNNKDGNPCNECEICKGIMNETIMDVIEMDAASNRKIEDIRDLRDKVVYPPSKTKYKIYIIDEVHMLTNEAFNALLKTLEEPPEHLVFILATTEMEKLPQTILSRLQRFDFKRIKTDNIVKNMKDILNKIEINVEDRALKLIARNSDGAMRDALSLLDQCIAYKDDISYEDALDILGIANTDLLFDLVNFIKDKDIEKVLFKVDEIIQDGKDINQFIKDLILHFRNLLIIKTSNASIELMDMDEEAFKKYREQGETFSVEFILRVLDILSDAETKGKWATQPRIILEMGLIKLVKLEEELPLIERVEKLEEKIASGNININSPSKINMVEDSKVEYKGKSIREKINKESKVVEATVDNIETKEPEEIEKKVYDNSKEYSFKEIEDKWATIMDLLRKKSIKTYAFLLEGRLYDYENNNIIIVYDEQFAFHREAISREDNTILIEEIVSSYFNKEINMKFLMSDEVVEKEPKEKIDITKEVVDFFGKDIVDIK